MWQISYPPANGASLGSYLVKNGLFCQKRGIRKQLWHPNVQTFTEMILIFDFWRDEAKNFRKTVLAARARQKNYNFWDNTF